MRDISSSEQAERISLRETFHDVLMSAWPLVKDKPGVLTRKQRSWVETYLRIFNEGDIFPTVDQVALALGVTRSISARMRKRVLRALLPIALQEDAEGSLDGIIEDRYLRLEQELSQRPEYLEKVRGVQGFTHWKAEEVFHERTGRTYRTMYSGETMHEVETPAHGLPIEKTTHHTPSPGSEWWHRRILAECERYGKDYRQAYIDLQAEAFSRWPEEKPYPERFCRVCGCLLPLGERIEEKLIKTNSKYCSDRCKTYSKRK